MKSKIVYPIAAIVAIAAFAVGFLVSPDSHPDENSPEAGFARDMAVHHEQAVVMAEFVRDDEGISPEGRQIATDIVLTQQAQIGQMHGWLGIWGLPIVGERPAMEWAGHPTDHMMGMATQEQLNALDDASGPEAERLFYELMVPHHEGGAAMSEDLLRRSDHPVVTSLARAIIDSQTAEIEAMENLAKRLDTQ